MRYTSYDLVANTFRIWMKPFYPIWIMMKNLWITYNKIRRRLYKRFTHFRICFASVPYGLIHDDVINWKHFPRYWPFVRGIRRSPVISPHNGQWRWALMFSLICAWINGWVNNGEAGDLIRHRAHYDVTLMSTSFRITSPPTRNLFIVPVLLQQLGDI